jgi:hypothetical protein
MFTQKFDTYVCLGDTITCEAEGFTFTARIEHDPDYHIDNDDCHNVDQEVTGCNEAQQKKLIEAREAWRNNDWFYCGIVISVSRNGVELNDHAASLWGIECNYPGSDNAYLSECANELIDDAVEAAREALEKTRAAIA